MADITKVIIVDDHQLILDGLRNIFADIPATNIIAEAHNGEQALKLIDSLQPDLVMMDVDMPVMNGLEACLQLRKSNPRVKVIILTMHDEPSLIRRIMEIGADAYLIKNSDQEKLRSAIEKVIAGEKVFDEELLSNNQQTGNVFSLKPSDAVLMSQLTEREIEILSLIADGLSNKEIGDKIFISHRTVDTHRTNLMRKLDIHNMAGLIRFAIRNGLIQS